MSLLIVVGAFVLLAIACWTLVRISALKEDEYKEAVRKAFRKDDEQ